MLLGWIDFVWIGTTLAYVSADAPTFVFSINADVTGVLEPGMRIKLTQTTNKFFIVTAVGAYAAGVTPVTVYGGADYTLANAAISAGAFSTHKKPFGFNTNHYKWTQASYDNSLHAQASPSANTWYNPGTLSLAIPIGAWIIAYEAQLYCVYIGVSVSKNISARATLSTGANTETDTELSSRLWCESANASTDERAEASIYRQHNVVLAAKATYYLNVNREVNTATEIGFNGVAAPTIIRAVCAYL